MPVYNETVIELKESIYSILNQSYRNFEYIIVDDNPDSPKIKNFLLCESKKDNRIRLIFNKKNRGAVLSANEAIKASKGSFIARMDADDISVHTRLEKQLKFCISNNLDFLSCNYFDLINNHLKKVDAYCDITQVNQKCMKRMMSYVNVATGSTLFFTKEAAMKLGGYRNILVEDYDLATRMLVNGYRVGYLSSPLIYKRYRINSLSGRNSLKEYVILSTISKYMRKYNFAKIIPISIINECVSQITQKDYLYFSYFLSYSMKYKHNRSLINLIKKYYWACSTILIFKRNVSCDLNKIIQYYLIK